MIIIKFVQIFFLTCVILITISCKKSNSQLDSFFHELELKIDNEKAIFKFKNLPKDSLLSFFEKFSKEFYLVYGDSLHYKTVNNFLNTKNISPDLEVRMPVLIFAFQSKLKYKNIYIESIVNDVQKYFEKIDSAYKIEEKINYLQILKNIQINNKEWNPGDTLEVLLPVETGVDEKKTTFYYHEYSLTSGYSSAEDSLKIKGILLSKRYDFFPDLKPNVIDSSNLIFSLKILEISDSTTMILLEKYKPGDKFDLHLKKYGRLIER